MATNDIFEIIHNRRSIRKFLDRPISDEVLTTILEAGFRAPFAAQLCSIVYTRDKQKMLDAKIGVYPTTQVFLIFLVDFRRLEKMMHQRGHEYIYDDGMSLWLGLQDVSLVVENVTLAAEAMSLGSVLLGLAPFRADTISELFAIPDRVFPVVGMCLGYPDPEEKTEIRPRFPLKFSAFEDSYLDHSESDMHECMKEIDEGYLAQGYYIKKKIKVPLREGKDEIDFDRYSWSEHISRKFSQRRGADNPLFPVLRRHGFNPILESNDDE
jgi:nitroreductase